MKPEISFKHDLRPRDNVNDMMNEWYLFSQMTCFIRNEYSKVMILTPAFLRIIIASIKIKENLARYKSRIEGKIFGWM